MADPDQLAARGGCLDENSNLFLHAYDPGSSPKPTLPSSSRNESNSIYIFNNTVNRTVHRRLLGRAISSLQIFQPNRQCLPAAWWKRRRFPTSCRRWFRRCKPRCREFLALTNKIDAVLDNAANATSTSNLNTIVAVQPLVTNFAVISGQLREPGGWLSGRSAPIGNSSCKSR